MSERVTNLMLNNAMEYLAEQLGVKYVPQGYLYKMLPGDITYESHEMRSNRYRFGIYRYEREYDDNNRVIRRTPSLHYPQGYLSMTKRELHDAARFAANAILAHRGIVILATERGEYHR